VTLWKPLGLSYKEDIPKTTPTHNSNSDQLIQRLGKWRHVVTPECPPPDNIPEIRDLKTGTGLITHEVRALENYRAPSWSFASLDARI
jgi:hypothetical protein